MRTTSDIPTLAPYHWAVDCSNRPNDLRLPVHTIMGARNWILERIPAEQKLVIITAENHFEQMDPMLQEALLHAHMNDKKHSFAFGYEGPCNLAQKNWESWQGRFPGDPDGRMAMGFIMCTTQGSRVGHLMDACLRDNISVSFNDLATLELPVFGADEPHLVSELRDPQVHRLMEQYGKSLHGFHEMGDPAIYPIRNYAIVENAKAHIERIGARIYIQHCGLDHLYGVNKTYDTSLHALFRKEGFAVLPVFAETSTVTTESVDTEYLGPHYINAVRIKGMAQSSWKKPFAETRARVIEASGPEIFGMAA